MLLCSSHALLATFDSQAMRDLWVFNVSCPAPQPVIQPLGAVVPSDVLARTTPVPYSELEDAQHFGASGKGAVGGSGADSVAAVAGAERGVAAADSGAVAAKGAAERGAADRGAAVRGAAAARGFEALLAQQPRGVRMRGSGGVGSSVDHEAAPAEPTAGEEVEAATTVARAAYDALRARLAQTEEEVRLLKGRCHAAAGEERE